MLRVNEVINAIRALGEKIEDITIMKKVLRSLPPRFDSKVFAINEAKDLKTFFMDEMYVSLTTYEMRIGKTKSIDREASVKLNKNAKGILELDEGEISDDAKVNFIKNLRRGKGKYKRNLPLKCFNYRDIGYFTSKYPYNEQFNHD